jgi:hypothetical protein
MTWCDLLFQVDALCPRRGSDGSGGSEQDKRVVTTLLTLLDGLHHPLLASQGNKTKAVLVIATTSKPDTIDPALRRPGRYFWLFLTLLSSIGCCSDVHFLAFTSVSIIMGICFMIFIYLWS